MKDVFMKFMEKSGTFELGAYYFRWNPETETVLLADTDSGRVYSDIEDVEELRDCIFEHDLPFRVCQVCGSPMSEGYTDEIGDTYFCERDEFVSDMNAQYGDGNWRVEPTGKRDWLYEFRENESSVWRPEPSFWTQWH